MSDIDVRNLCKTYDDVAVVDGVSLRIEAGEIFGILGPNGAGKTTTVEMIAGLRTPDGGTVSIGGLDPQRERAAVRQRVGIQLQSSKLPDRITVTEALELFASFYDDPADVAELVGDLGLSEKRDAQFAQLSGGQQQRLSVALALVGQPTVAILDELTTGLDPQARRDTWAVIEGIRERGVTVVLVSHAMEEVEHLCDRVAILDRGQVVACDSPAGIVEGLGDAQRITFRASPPPDIAALEALEEVGAVSLDGTEVSVAGRGDLLFAVISELTAQHVHATELRSERATLDDAFLALTGRSFDKEVA